MARLSKSLGKINNVPISFSGSPLFKSTSKKVRFESDIPISRICLVGSLAQDKETRAASLQFSLPFVTSKDGLEYAEDKKYVTYFILSQFETEEFEALHRRNMKIIGKPAFMVMSLERGINYKNPIFCFTMSNCFVSITGFENASVTDKLKRLIGYMGGNYRTRIHDTDKNRFLVAYSSKGKMYNYAIANDIPVMSEDWVYAVWAYRKYIGVKAKDSNFLSYQLKYFENFKIALVGFSEEDINNMEWYIKNNGGISTTYEDNTATHVIVNPINLPEETLNFPPEAFVVEKEWFWDSLQDGYCVSERHYLYDNKVAKNPSVSMCSPRFISSNRLSSEPLCRGRFSSSSYSSVKPRASNTKTHKPMFGSNCIQNTRIIILILLMVVIYAYCHRIIANEYK